MRSALLVLSSTCRSLELCSSPAFSIDRRVASFASTRRTPAPAESSAQDSATSSGPRTRPARATRSMPASGATSATAAGGTRKRCACTSAVGTSLTHSSQVAGSAALTPKTAAYFAPIGFSETPELGWPAMRRMLPPQHGVGLLVAVLLCLMAAGVATMAKYGPKRGHTYAALQQDHR